MTDSKGHPNFHIQQSQDLAWLSSEDIRPYVYMRKDNLFESPGTYIPQCDWFGKKPIYKDPLKMSEVGFADQILNFEGKAFQKSAMQMPRWVFYDCGVVPGFIGGFAARTSSLSAHHKEVVGVNEDLEWTPISLFIIIPTVRKGEWVAHNLCTTNALVRAEEKKYALGFLTKAFGLWYANVEILCGITQWQSPAIRLHSHYGPFEILTAYTPVHSYPRTLTYRSRLDFDYWPSFFSRKGDELSGKYKFAGFQVDPKSDESLKYLQSQLESEKGPFFLSPFEIRTQGLDVPLNVYRI